MDYEKRKQVAEWLNTLGYDFEITSDGLWMEDYDFTEHKTKDVIDIVLAWEEKRLNEAKATLPIKIVTQQSEPFLAFLEYIQESEKNGETIIDNELFVKGFLKAKYGG